ncbi:MAG: XDD3 family exosortase-dependent surface protein [Cyanobacteria bacterium J06626_18]
MITKILTVPAALLLMSVGSTSVRAAAIHYTVDSFSDGVNGDVVGGPDSAYELYGVAYAQTDTTLYVGFSSNLPIGGQPTPDVTGGSVAWGDLFFNFTDLPFAAAVASGEIYGVRFDAANDSPVSLGLYQVQQTNSVTSTNGGFASLAAYQTTVTGAGGTPSLGDVPFDGSYLSHTGGPQNIIAQGTLVSSEVSFIEDFSTVGFASDFGFGAELSETGSYSYGFSVEKSGLPLGDFIAHVLAECANDSIAFVGTLLGQTSQGAATSKSVPEPANCLSLLAIGAGYAIWHQRQRQTLQRR